MRKQTICLGENSNCEADHRLCFRYTDSTISLLSKSKIFSLYPSSVTVQPGLCWTWSDSKLLIFSCTDSRYVETVKTCLGVLRGPRWLVPIGCDKLKKKKNLPYYAPVTCNHCPHPTYGEGCGIAGLKCRAITL